MVRRQNGQNKQVDSDWCLLVKPTLLMSKAEDAEESSAAKASQVFPRLMIIAQRKETSFKRTHKHQNSDMLFRSCAIIDIQAADFVTHDARIQVCGTIGAPQ
jgi:hypothetical protein